MPAAYTHALYGEWVLEALDASLQTLIQKHRNEYNIGLHGPDILFFYKPLKKNSIKEKGYGMHNESARPFFEQARLVIQNNPDTEAALAYIFGFINHFVLDSECHGLINQTVKTLPISHSELESELDALLMREKGLNHIATKVTTHLAVTKEADEVIAPFFAVTPQEIDESLRSMIRFLDLFVAPGKIKRNFIFTVMKIIGQYDGMHGLIFNREPNLKCSEVCTVLRGKMDQAIEVSVALIQEYWTQLNQSTGLSDRFDRNFE